MKSLLAVDWKEGAGSLELVGSELATTADIPTGGF